MTIKTAVGTPSESVSGLDKSVSLGVSTIARSRVQVCEELRDLVDKVIRVRSQHSVTHRWLTGVRRSAGPFAVLSF